MSYGQPAIKGVITSEQPKKSCNATF